MLIAAAILLPFAFRSSLNAWAREQVISNLRDSFASDLEFGSLNVAVFPQPRVKAEHVVLRYHGRKDILPLIEIKAFSAEASLLGFLRKHVVIARVDGLQIHVPPRNERSAVTESKPRSAPMVIDLLTAGNSRLEIEPAEPGKQPLIFDIHQLTMHSVARDRPAPFEATLSNPRPPGEIATRGQFGPWKIEDPRETPLSAGYTFTHADLGVFRGIAGTLSSKGKFSGVLEHIEVEGDTDTPDFMVSISGHRVALHTQFHAIVDGTNGNTQLTPVHAEFLHSNVEAQGRVMRPYAGAGRTVSLDVTVANGRLEDMLRLAVKGDPVMTGRVGFRTKLELPPGDADVMDRLRLNGEFGVTAGKFTQLNVQEKVKDLSRRAQGEPENEAAGSAVSNLRGRFTLRDGIVHFSNLTFSVPGASVQLNGACGLHGERLDFHGTVRLEAKLSETTTGFKSFLLKAVDPFFKKKGAGAVVPIKITGTRTSPSYGLDIGHKSK